MKVVARTKLDLALRTTGSTRHYDCGRLIEGIVRLQIEGEEGDFYLFHFDAEGRNVIDTWHETLDAAFEQASFEYGIGAGDWVKQD